MTLFERMYEPFRFVVRVSVSSGEGGSVTTWTDGEEFVGKAAFDNSIEARTGAAAGVSSRYTLTAPVSVPLVYHAIVKRLSDGKVLRVTSDGDDVVTPSMASFTFHQVSAEEYELTGGAS